MSRKGVILVDFAIAGAFVRWRRAAGAHDVAVQMIDTSIVRVHQHAACIARNRRGRPTLLAGAVLVRQTSF